VNKYFIAAERRACRVAAIALVSVLTFQLSSSVAQADESKMSARLVNVLEQTSNPVPVVVMLQQLTPLPHTVWGKIPSAQVETMIKHRILENQRDLRAHVAELMNNKTFGANTSIRNVKYFWNVNAMMATASVDTIYSLSDRDDVAFVYLDERIKLAPDYRVEADVDGSEFTYGLEKIGVPALRQANPDISGKGVIVGILDTGIDPKHPEFEGKTITFKDLVGGKKDAYDDHGHGTHVAGTIAGIGAGGTQIGVAPGVTQLVIGKVFTASGGGSLSSILKGMEFMADPDGKPETPDQPRVINNSWGGNLGDSVENDPFSPAVFTWVQLNIFPSFAAGNSGPSASSVGSPGGLPQSFAVGATDQNDKVTSFSSRGPVSITHKGERVKYVKPDVSAPGKSVLSAMPGGKYGEMSGTSMATPHTTGAIALVIQTKPDATIVQVRDILMKSSKDLGQSGMDNDYGAGRLDVNHAYEMIMNGAGR